MKKILLIVFGVLLTMTVGLFLFAHWFFIPFEHRDNHNGVGWSAFAQSVRKHVSAGPYKITDFGHYEGSVNFNVADERKNSYHLWTSRFAYSDARNMHTLESAKLRVKKVSGQSLVCKNNFGEDEHLFVSRDKLLLSNEVPDSINKMIEASGPLVSSFGDTLPMTYMVLDGKVTDVPDWVFVDIKRTPGCCSGNIKDASPVISISCRLEE